MTENPQASNEQQNNENQEQANNNNVNNEKTDNENNEKDKKEEPQENPDAKYTSIILLEFAQAENNKNLNEMLSDLIIYKKSKENQEPSLLKTTGSSIKQMLYEKLEKSLIETVFIKNKERCSETIQHLYQWYKNKKGTFDDLKKITSKTYKEKNEVDDLDVYLEKEEERKAMMEKEELEDKSSIEKIYAHRNVDILTKDMLDDYKVKKIDVYKKNKITGKKIMKSYTRIPFNINQSKSTFYSDKNGLNSFTLKKIRAKLLPPTKEQASGGTVEKTFQMPLDKDVFPPLNKETKFSYSFARPSYSYHTMYVENKIIQSKMKLAGEKISEEQMEKKLAEFGKQRAIFKENLINKFELKNVINMYVNTNNFDSPLLEKYKIQKDEPKIEEVEKEEKALINRKRTTISENNPMRNSLNFENSSGLGSVGNRNLKRSQSTILMNNNLNLLNRNSKMEINNVKNLNAETNSIMEKNSVDVKFIQLNMKQQNDLVKEKVLNRHEGSKTPNDAVGNLSFRNSFFKQKLLYNMLCGTKFKKKEKTKGGDGEESESEYHNFYMSAYDFGNIRKIDNFKKFKKIPLSQCKTKLLNSENISGIFGHFKDNFLDLRKTMSSWKKRDADILCNKMIQNKENVENKKTLVDESNKNHEIFNKIRIGNILRKRANSVLSAMVNPDIGIYPQYFLPRSGSFLLQRNDKNATKTKKGKRKRR